MPLQNDDSETDIQQNEGIKIEIEYAAEFDEGEEGIDTAKTSEVKRRKKGSLKRRRFRLTSEQKKILLAAYDKLEENVVDKVHIINELGTKLNLPRNKIEVSRMNFSVKSIS